MKRKLKKLIRQFGFDIVKYPNINDEKPLYTSFYGKESVDKRAFYNISAGGHYGFGGKFLHPCWTNVDVDLGNDIFPMYNPEIDIAHDLLDCGDLPIDDNSAELCQSRFAIEHIHDEAALKLFKEVRRVLKRDGTFKIVVPNFRIDYEAYKRKDYGYFSWLNTFSSESVMKVMGFKVPLNKASFQQVVLAHFAANASTIHIDGSSNRISDEEFDHIMNSNLFETAFDTCVSRCSIEKHRKYRKNHINWWDYNKLQKFLLEAGFKKILFLSPGQSSSSVMRGSAFFDNQWNSVALYAEAIK